MDCVLWCIISGYLRLSFGLMKKDTIETINIVFRMEVLTFLLVMLLAATLVSGSEIEVEVEDFWGTLSVQAGEGISASPDAHARRRQR